MCESFCFTWNATFLDDDLWTGESVSLSFDKVSEIGASNVETLDVGGLDVEAFVEVDALGLLSDFVVGLQVCDVMLSVGKDE